MIGFRVDANETIATGHLIRCISIADACRKAGMKCMFFLAEEKETARLEKMQMPYHILHTDWKQMDSDLEYMKLLSVEYQLEWLVVDSYQATEAYLEKLNQEVKVLYIDDFRTRKYKVSALLQYIPIEGNCAENEKVSLLKGFSYAPLREEFVQSSPNVNREKSILITTGGTDRYNVTGRLLHYCLDREELSEYSFQVIIGSMNQNEQELREIASKNQKVSLYKNVSNISEFMRTCEIAVSAGGTTLLELCACKIPTVCFSFAENQRGFAVEMGKKSVLRYVGDAEELENIEVEIFNELLFFAQKPVEREAYAKRMGTLVDGRGAERIADFLKLNLKNN